MRREISVTDTGPQFSASTRSHARSRSSSPAALRSDERSSRMPPTSIPNRATNSVPTASRPAPSRGIRRRDGLRPVEQAALRPQQVRDQDLLDALRRSRHLLAVRAALPAQRRRIGLLHRHRDRQHRGRERGKPLLLARRPGRSSATRPPAPRFRRSRPISGREVRRRRRQRRPPLDRELQHPGNGRVRTDRRRADQNSRCQRHRARPAGSGSTSRTTTCTCRSTSATGRGPLHGGERLRARARPRSSTRPRTRRSRSTRRRHVVYIAGSSQGLRLRHRDGSLLETFGEERGCSINGIAVDDATDTVFLSRGAARTGSRNGRAPSSPTR